MKLSDVEQESLKPSEQKGISVKKAKPTSETEKSRIELISDTDEFLKLEESWNKLMVISDSTIFQSFTWNKTWWKYFGEKKELFVLTMYNGDDELVGILPCFVDNLTYFGRDIYTCLRLLGTSVSQPDGEDLKGLKAYSDYLDMIVHPGYEREFATEIVCFLMQASFRFHEIIFEEVQEDSSIYKHLLPLFDEKRILYTSKKLSACPVSKLEKTWEGYLKTMSKRRRNHTRKFIRKVNDPKIKIFDLSAAETKQELENRFETLVEIHQKHWNSYGYPGVFAEKRYHHFLKETTTELFSKGCVWLNSISSAENNKKVEAIDLHFIYKNKIYLLQRAYDSSSKMQNDSPGTVLLYNSIKEGIRQNYEYFDFLRGADRYKYRTANLTLENKIITVTSLGLPIRFYHKLIKHIPVMRRKIRQETDKMRLIVRGKKPWNGIRDYAKFVQKRLKSK